MHLHPNFECDECSKTFITERACIIHMLKTHFRRSTGSAFRTDDRVPRRMWNCPHPACKRKGLYGSVEWDNLVQHRRNVHYQPTISRRRKILTPNSSVLALSSWFFSSWKPVYGLNFKEALGMERKLDTYEVPKSKLKLRIGPEYFPSCACDSNKLGVSQNRLFPILFSSILCL